MTILNILLPDSMHTFVEEQIAKGNYSNASEYIHHLISQAQKQAQQEQLEVMLLEGLDSGEPIEVTDEWWEQKRNVLVQREEQQKQ